MTHVILQPVSQWVFVSCAALWLAVFQAAPQQVTQKEDYSQNVRVSLAGEVINRMTHLYDQSCEVP